MTYEDEWMDNCVRLHVEPCQITIDHQIFTYKVVNKYWKVTVALFADQMDALAFVWDYNKRYTGER